MAVYAVGEEFVGAMVDVYGEESPRRFLLGLRSAHEDGYAGAALWRVGLHRVGMMMSPIASRFFARVATATPEGPRVRVVPFVAASVDKGSLRVRSVDENGQDLPLSEVAAFLSPKCEVRNPQAHGLGASSGSCTVARSALTGGVAEVQVRSDGGWSDWLRLPLPGL